MCECWYKPELRAIEDPPSVQLCCQADFKLYASDRGQLFKSSIYLLLNGQLSPVSQGDRGQPHKNGGIGDKGAPLRAACYKAAEGIFHKRTGTARQCSWSQSIKLIWCVRSLDRRLELWFLSTAWDASANLTWPTVWGFFNCSTGKQNIGIGACNSSTGQGRRKLSFVVYATLTYCIGKEVSLPSNSDPTLRSDMGRKHRFPFCLWSDASTSRWWALPRWVVPSICCNIRRQLCRSIQAF